MLTAKQAADHVGKSKATILKAIKTGRLSASKSDDGEWKIDPAELFRVYQYVPTQEENSALGHSEVHTQSTAETAALQDKLATLEQERERERHQLEATIADLRHRLDAEAEERRRLTMMLTDQRPKQPEAMPAPPQEAQESRLTRAWRILTGKG